MKRKRDTTSNVKHAESIERVEKEKKYRFNTKRSVTSRVAESEDLRSDSDSSF